MRGVLDCVYIETGLYKVFGGHVAGDGMTCPKSVCITQGTGGAWASWLVGV